MASVVALVLCVGKGGAAAESDIYSFGVISQRSPVLTAQYWNPIIRYVSEKSGVPLRVRIGNTGPDTSEMIRRGEVDFIFSNHIFHPDNLGSGYYVIARDGGESISGQIVVPNSSKILAIEDLAGKTVVFPSKVAFVGYMVPIHHLNKSGVSVEIKFAGNQEGAMGQLLLGSAEAAGVNSEVMREYSNRMGYYYRTLWTSKPYLSMPVAAKPSVPKKSVEAVRGVLAGMINDPEGQRILLESAQIIGQKKVSGFALASDHQYKDQRGLYQEVTSSNR